MTGVLALCWLRQNNDIFCEGFEPLCVWLEHRDGDMAGFAGVDVLDDAGFTRMHAADDFALGAVLQFAWGFNFLFHSSEYGAAEKTPEAFSF